VAVLRVFISHIPAYRTVRERAKERKRVSGGAKRPHEQSECKADERSEEHSFKKGDEAQSQSLNLFRERAS